MTDRETRAETERLVDGPAPRIVDAAIECSKRSPCRSKRGVVIFRERLIIARGFNDKPLSGTCDGSLACKATCRTEAVHAEQSALLRAGLHAQGSDLLHVKTVDGQLVVSGGPSCVQCSKLALAAGIRYVWLYELTGWQRYDAPDFHRRSVRAAASALTATAERERVLREALNNALTIATASLGTVAMDPNPPRRSLRQIRDLLDAALRPDAPAPPVSRRDLSVGGHDATSDNRQAETAPKSDQRGHETDGPRVPIVPSAYDPDAPFHRWTRDGVENLPLLPPRVVDAPAPVTAEATTCEHHIVPHRDGGRFCAFCLKRWEDKPSSPEAAPQEQDAICRICQMRLPERLVTFGPGPRGGRDAVCAACCGRAGYPVDEAKRAEVVALRKARA